jgi:hypothetical protein
MKKGRPDTADELRPEYDLKSLVVRRLGYGRKSFSDSAIRLDLQGLLLGFFLTFSRFEFALKNSGFYVKRRETSDPYEGSPDWDSFAQRLTDVFDCNATPKVRNACDRLLDNPPAREVIGGGGLGWDAEAENDSLSDIERLLRYVRRIRNNLFHGAKFSTLPGLETERNVTLLEDSLIVLDECLRLTDDVRQTYESAAL